MNAQQEYIEHIEDREVKCAAIRLGHYSIVSVVIQLPVGYSKIQLTNFLLLLNVEYNSGYGSQELSGIIWYTDGTWSSRGEYDGSEWWEYNKCPEVPQELIK